MENNEQKSEKEIVALIKHWAKEVASAIEKGKDPASLKSCKQNLTYWKQQLQDFN